MPRCIHHRRRRLSKIVSAQRRVWYLLLLRLRLKYLFRRASLFLELPFTWSLCDLTTGYFARRSLSPSSRSLPADRDQLQGSFGVTGRTTRPRLPLICAIPISPQSNDLSISFTESTIHSKSTFRPDQGPSSFLLQPSVRYAFSPATDHLILGARLRVSQAVNQGTVGQGLSLRNREALTVVKVDITCNLKPLRSSEARLRLVLSSTNWILDLLISLVSQADPDLVYTKQPHSDRVSGDTTYISRIDRQARLVFDLL